MRAFLCAVAAAVVLTRPVKFKDATLLQLRQRSTYRFDGKPKVVCNVVTAHWQRYESIWRLPLTSLNLSKESQHLVGGALVPKIEDM